MPVDVARALCHFGQQRLVFIHVEHMLQNNGPRGNCMCGPILTTLLWQDKQDAIAKAELHDWTLRLEGRCRM